MTSNAPPRPVTGAWFHSEYNSGTDINAFERWRGDLAPVLDVSVDAQDRKTFSAQIAVAQAGHALLMRTQADAQLMQRSATHIRRDAIDHFCIAFLHAGRSDGDYQQISSHADTTSILFADEAQESRRRYSRFEALRLLIPRSRIPAELRGANVHGLTVPITRGGAGLLASHVQTLARTIDQLTKSEAQAAIDAAMLLVPGALNASQPFFERLDPSFDDSLMSIIKTYIENHVCGTAVSPAAISQRFGLSRSSLYRLFECEGGVARYIMNKKLDLGRHLLSNGNGDTVLVRSVAERTGFKSEAHFSRAFKQRFHMTPREARQLSLETKNPAKHAPRQINVQRRMLELFRTIGKP
jgi:AraC-like DNA-binding protein